MRKLVSCWIKLQSHSNLIDNIETDGLLSNAFAISA